MEIQTIVNSILKSCTHILYDKNERYIYLIDCGDSQPIISFLSKYDKRLKGIFLTHCHYDHIYGLNTLAERYKEVTVYGSKKTLEGLYDSKINLSKYHGSSFIYSRWNNIHEITSHSKIDIFSSQITVIETPGHDVECLSYIVNNCLFTGDAYIPGLSVFTKWHRSNKQQALNSEAHLKILIAENKYKLYPGHLIDD